MTSDFFANNLLIHSIEISYEWDPRILDNEIDLIID